MEDWVNFHGSCEKHERQNDCERPQVYWGFKASVCVQCGCGNEFDEVALHNWTITDSDDENLPCEKANRNYECQPVSTEINSGERINGTEFNMTTFMETFVTEHLDKCGIEESGADCQNIPLDQAKIASMELDRQLRTNGREKAIVLILNLR